MADNCECLFTPEAFFRRISDMLTQNQELCNDVECDDLAIPSSGNTTTMIITMWLAFAMFMFFVRPNSLRATPQNETTKNRPFNDNSDDNDGPPPAAI
uniref:Small integral membrane protein 14 n=1 Tax=Rhabditophanes sp. KR3021 TaxID=114890 RepID=A0AC35THG6_9BILA